MASINVQQAEAYAALLKAAWKATPATMAHKLSEGAWIPAKHLMYLSTIIARELSKGGARVLVSMPPRHGKSEFLSYRTSAWFMEKYPERNVMGLSYGLELATDFALKVRTDFLNEDYYDKLTTRLNKDKLKIDRFLTTKGGGYTAAGLGGVITGRGAHYLFVDDYIKNAEAALSLTQREAIWNWFQTTAWTRREPGCSVVILATRWDKDDLIGRCLTEMPDENWIVINLPAFARENDPLGRLPGEALWPERYDAEELEKIRKALGNYWFEAMYQQDPLDSMSGANLGNKLKTIRESELPHHSMLKEVRAWDLAATTGAGDWTAGPRMALQPQSGKIYIRDMSRFQKTPGSTELMVKVVAGADGYGIPIWMEQEPGSAGVTVIDHYAKEVLAGWSFKGDKPTGPIEVRAQPFLAAVESGNVHIVAGPWNQALKDELNAFPDGDHDDQVSALALAYHKLMKNRKGGLTWGNEVVGAYEMANGLLVPKETHIHVPDQGQRLTGLTW